jgi:hypothetical protein
MRNRTIELLLAAQECGAPLSFTLPTQQCRESSRSGSPGGCRLPGPTKPTVRNAAIAAIKAKSVNWRFRPQAATQARRG